MPRIINKSALPKFNIFHSRTVTASVLTFSFFSVAVEVRSFLSASQLHLQVWQFVDCKNRDKISGEIWKTVPRVCSALRSTQKVYRLIVSLPYRIKGPTIIYGRGGG